jgi:hypothetical protein
MSCPAFWLDAPSVLWTQATEFFPFTEQDRRCTAAALNSFTRFGVYLGILLALVRLEPLWLLAGVAFAGFAVGAWFFMGTKGAVREGLVGSSIQAENLDRRFITDAPILDPRDVINEYAPDVIGMGQRERTTPTAANPFMNVLLTEISDNPYRNPAANSDGLGVRAELDSYFQTMFASDPGDVFGKTQSQRSFVANPVTTIPNDQSAFANWLYRVPGQTYKEGNLMASQHVSTGTDVLPWRSLARGT